MCRLVTVSMTHHNLAQLLSLIICLQNKMSGNSNTVKFTFVPLYKCKFPRNIPLWQYHVKHRLPLMHPTLGERWPANVSFGCTRVPFKKWIELFTEFNSRIMSRGESGSGRFECPFHVKSWTNWGPQMFGGANGINVHKQVFIYMMVAK